MPFTPPRYARMMLLLICDARVSYALNKDAREYASRFIDALKMKDEASEQECRSHGR